MKQVERISIEGASNELQSMSTRMFDALVEAVVDIDKRLVVVDAGLHSDQELYLMEHGSAQNDLWGINLWPENYGSEDFIEFDSLINLRPQQGNRSRGG